MATSDRGPRSIVRTIGVAASLLAVLLPSALHAPATGAVIVNEPDRAPCANATPATECAWLAVPLDHALAGSPTVRLLTRRLRAPLDAGHIGVLVTIAGGPGQRGTDFVRPGMHAAAIEQRFDIVSWDPRGTSYETRVDCLPDWDPYEGLDRTPDTMVERRLLDAETARLARGCRAEHAELLPYVATIDSVRDLEKLRQMLGEEQISVLASSYGTQVALMYATLFPERVRAMVLDGLSDPNLDPDELEAIQAAAFERELDRLLAACASDRDCPFHSGGRPGDALDRLLKLLDGGPGSTTDSASRTASQADAYEAILGSLVAGPHARDRLLAALASVASGDGAPLHAIAEGIRSSYESTGLTQGTFMSTYCADTAAFWNEMTRTEATRFTRRIADLAPRLGPWLWSPSSANDLPPVGLCAMLPDAEPRADRTFDAAGSGPILVLGTTGDPTTPVEAARDATEALEVATQVTLDSDHHLAYQAAVRDPRRPAHRCVLEAVESHLIDLELAGPDAFCGSA